MSGAGIKDTMRQEVEGVQSKPRGPCDSLNVVLLHCILKHEHEENNLAIVYSYFFWKKKNLYPRNTHKMVNYHSRGSPKALFVEKVKDENKQGGGSTEIWL